MRKILIAVLLFISFQSYGQNGWVKPNNSVGTIQNGGAFTRALMLPTGNGMPTLAATDSLQKSALYFDSTNHIFWAYDPRSRAWDSIHMGPNLVPGISVPWGAITGTLSSQGDLVSALNGKVDSMTRTRGTDSFYWWRNGVRYALLDSLGSGGGSGSSVDSLTRTVGVDSIYWWKSGISHGVKDSTGGGGWGLTGNSGTSAGTNFIGTTDNQDLVLKTNNTEQIRFLSTGGIRLPTISDSTTGVIFKGVDRFIHDFAAVGGLGQNLFIGKKSGNFTMTGGPYGSRNTAIGDSTLFANTTGYRNTVMGIWAGAANTTGFENTVVGANAHYNNTTGFQNTAIGAISLELNTTGFRNIAVGFSAMQYGTIAERNTAVGGRSMQNISTGFANSAVGFDALNGITTGDHNVAVGLDALYYSNGSKNTAIGDSTLWGLYGSGIKHMGYKNTAIGSRAGYYLGDTYSNFASIYDTASTFLGANASRDSSIPYTTSLQNMTVIGYNAKGFASNQVVLGNSNVTTTLLRGKVGIGTTAPDSTLHIVGGLKLPTLYAKHNASDSMMVVDNVGGVGYRAIPSGGGSTPAGNYGNIQINRNGVLTTPGSDSLSFIGAFGLRSQGIVAGVDNTVSIGAYIGNSLVGLGDVGIYDYGSDGRIATFNQLLNDYYYGNGSLILNEITGKDTLTGTLTITDSLKAGTIKRIGGTSSQFLKADGSVDANAYTKVSDTTSMLSHYFNQIGYGILNTGQAIRVDSATLNTAMRSYVSGAYLPINNPVATGKLTAPIDSITGNAIANSSPIHGNGTWFTGGTATSTKPYLLIEPTGTTSTAWLPNGTGLGINAATGFTGNLADFQVSGGSKASIASDGMITAAGNGGVSYQLPGGNAIRATSAGNIFLDQLGASGNIILRTTNGSVIVGGTTSTTNKFQVNGTTQLKTISWGSAASGSYVEKGFLDSSGNASIKGLNTGYVAKTLAYTLTITDHTVNVTANSNNYTLPTAVGATGQEYIIKNTGSGAPVVNTTSSQTIDGSLTYTLSTINKYVHVQSDGANWIIISNN